ncbi:MAG: hypothetical protein AAF468_18780 [Pseudomonadota bacterium]
MVGWDKFRPRQTHCDSYQHGLQFRCLATIKSPKRASNGEIFKNIVNSSGAAKTMIFSPPKWLLVPYAANIIILIPVCYGMFIGNGVLSVFEGNVAESDGLRFLVGSLWFAILTASIAGLCWPAFFAPIIMVQILYKSLWLLAFVLSAFMADNPVPIGISITFILIVVTYPIFLGLACKQ